MSPNHHRNLDAATIYDSQLQKTKLLHAQPQQQETLTQPLHGDLQRRSCKTIARHKQETKSQLGTFRATARVSAPVAQASQFISATERPHTWKKHTVSRKSWHSNLILDVAVPRRSGNSELHSLLQKQKRIATHYSRTSSFWRNLPHQPAANNQWWSPTEQIRTCTIEKSSEECGESYDGWPILHDQTSHIQDHTSPKQQRRWQEICKQRHNTAWTSWSIYYVTFELRNTTNKKCTQQSRHKASAHSTSMCTQTLIGQVAQQQGSPQAGSQWRYWVPQYTNNSLYLLRLNAPPNNRHGRSGR